MRSGAVRYGDERFGNDIINKRRRSRISARESRTWSLERSDMDKELLFRGGFVLVDLDENTVTVVGTEYKGETPLTSLVGDLNLVSDHPDLPRNLWALHVARKLVEERFPGGKSEESKETPFVICGGMKIRREVTSDSGERDPDGKRCARDRDRDEDE